MNFSRGENTSGLSAQKAAHEVTRDLLFALKKDPDSYAGWVYGLITFMDERSESSSFAFHRDTAFWGEAAAGAIHHSLGGRGYRAIIRLAL